MSNEEEQIKYVLLADVKGETSSLFCGVTVSGVVAQAWSMGAGHWVVKLPELDKLRVDGYEWVDFWEEDE